MGDMGQDHDIGRIACKALAGDPIAHQVDGGCKHLEERGLPERTVLGDLTQGQGLSLLHRGIDVIREITDHVILQALAF